MSNTHWNNDDAAAIAKACNEAGRPYMAEEIILKATDMVDAVRRLEASEPRAMMRASMLKEMRVTEAQLAAMKAKSTPPAVAPPPSPLERAEARRKAQAEMYAKLAPI